MATKVDWKSQPKKQIEKKAKGLAIAKALPEIDGEIIPSTAMPRFKAAVVRSGENFTGLLKIENEVRAWKPTDAASRLRGGELVASIKAMETAEEDNWKPLKKVLKTISDFVNKRANRVYDLAGDLRKNVLNPQLQAYDEMEEKRAQAERDRVAKEKQAQLDREAEVQRQKDIAAAKERKEQRVDEIRADLKNGKITLAQSKQLLLDAGAAEEAAKVDAALKEQESKVAAVASAAAIEVAPNVPTQQGVTKRKNPKFRVVNAQAVKLKFLVPDLVAIGAVVRAADYDQNEEEVKKRIAEEIGGIEVYFERTY